MFYTVCFIFYFITLIFILDPIATAAPPAPAPPATTVAATAPMAAVALVSMAVAPAAGAAAAGAQDTISPALFFFLCSTFDHFVRLLMQMTVATRLVEWS